MPGFRMKGSEKRTALMHVCGMISGGKYDGWRYSFVRFAYDAKENLLIELVAAEPDWPFPRTLILGKNSFGRLEPMKGERAAKLDTAPLIEEAFTRYSMNASAGRDKNSESDLAKRFLKIRASAATRSAVEARIA
jgi:hypothetical protein